MTGHDEVLESKVPEITLWFWITKILATTLGETGGDAVSMSMHMGYLLSTGIFLIVFASALVLQIRSRRFQPAVYWVTIVASTTVGTTLADYVDRSLGIGYAGGTALLAGLLMLSLLVWHTVTHSVDVRQIRDPRSEVFYWITIMFSQTLGTALGDWTADSAGFGYLGGTGLFAGLLALVALCLLFRGVSRVLLFWCAFVLTRPLGAVVGDFLDKPLAEGGLALSRIGASAVLMLLMLACVLLLPQRAARGVAAQ